MKLMIVGTKPNDTIWKPGSRALVGSRSGDRLARLMGVDLTDGRVETRNLFEAHEVVKVDCRRRAAEVLDYCKRHGVTHVVFLVNPRRVVDTAAARLKWYEDVGGMSIAFSPHPSGLSRWWNDEDNRQAALRFWRHLGSMIEECQQVSSP